MNLQTWTEALGFLMGLFREGFPVNSYRTLGSLTGQVVFPAQGFLPAPLAVW
jgi:hypothetical protein